MIKPIIMLIAMSGMGASSGVQAQSLSGDIGIYNKYLDYDLFPLTDQPVIQGSLYAGVTEECSLMAWSSHGIATSEGGELDVGAICYVPIVEGTVTLYGLRSFLRGAADAWTIAAGYEYGGADLTVEQYFWDGNPDGTRIIAGYTHEGIEGLIMRPLLTYETGLGVAEMLAGGLAAEYALTGGVSLTARGLAPLIKDKSGLRTAELQFGLRHSF